MAALYCSSAFWVPDSDKSDPNVFKIQIFRKQRARSGKKLGQQNLNIYKNNIFNLTQFENRRSPRFSPEKHHFNTLPRLVFSSLVAVRAQEIHWPFTQDRNLEISKNILSKNVNAFKAITCMTALLNNTEEKLKAIIVKFWAFGNQKSFKI